MIRIDEIYNNVFLPLVQHKPDVGLHWFDPFGSVQIEHIVNIPPVDRKAKQRIIFWDQEPLHRDLFSAFMNQFRLMYEGPVLLVTSEQDSEDVTWAKDTYGIESAYYFFHGWAALDWYRGYNHSFLWPEWCEREIGKKLFCANNIIGGGRQHRVRLVSGMAKQNLLDSNMVSFPDRCPYSRESADDLCNSLGVDRIPDLPLVIDRIWNHANDSHKIDFGSQVTKCFCHVVTETVYQGSKLHLTEKTFKPIVLQQPFLMLAPRHSLSYLRSYGFRTFDAIWDESYDSLPDHSRLEAVLDVMKEVNSWSSHIMANKQTKITHVVKHNHAWFYGGFQDLLWKELCGMVKNW